MPENNQNKLTNVERERCIECMLHPELAPIYARKMLLGEDPIYLIKFIGMNQDRLTTEHIYSAIRQVSMFDRPDLIWFLFFILKPEFQIEVCERVAWQLLVLDDEYYLAKFAYYCRFIANIGQINLLKLSHHGITDEWLLDWLEKVKTECRSALTKIIIDLEKSNQPIKSPDSKTIKGREGFKPEYIVLHSAGAASPVERIAYNFLSPDTNAVSAHFVVSKEGCVYQFVDLEDAAKTNGTSDDPNMDNYYGFSKHGFFSHNKTNANNFTVTIETEEFGYKGMLSFKQYQAVLKTLALIHRECDIPIDRNHVLGHRDIAPFSKWYCPGESFPISDLVNDFDENQISPITPLNPRAILELY